MLIAFAALLAAMGSVLPSFRGGLYINLDGMLALVLAEAARAWNSPWAQSQISHLQGLGAQQLPVNPWLNPGYAVFFSGTALPMIVSSYLFFAGSLFLAVYGLGRSLGLGRLGAALGAQASCVLLFPPLEMSLGLDNQLRLNPGVVYHGALALALIALLVDIGDRSAPLARGALAAAFSLLLLYSLLCDPVWAIVPLVSLSPFFAAALGSGPGRASLFRRGAAVLGAALILIALAVPSYLQLLLAYTARSRFRAEMFGEVQDRLYTFLPFRGHQAATLFGVLLAGLLCALVWGRERRVRLFAAAGLVHMALLCAMSAVYLYADVNWTYPVPSYFQLGALPIYVLLSAAGAGAALQRLPAAASLTPRWARSPAVIACLLPAAYLGLSAAEAVATTPTLRLQDERRLGKYRPGEPPFLQQLESELAAAPGRPFRGSVTTVLSGPDDYRALRLQLRLWAMEVPTLEEYSQLVSPPLYYLATRGLGGPGDGPAGRNRLRVTNPRVGLLRALGVRYVWAATNSPVALPETPDVKLAAIDFKGNRLHELREPNLGTYSPVRVLLARTAPETVRLLTSPEIDLEQDVVLYEPVAGPLVPLSAASMAFADGGVRVRASSAGRSIVLLPLQFSHALRVRASRGAATLQRANLAQTALVFDGEIDAFISLDFGFGRTAGRARDLADLDALAIREEGDRRLGQADWESLHPYFKLRLSGP